jgi:hypothetical protein
MAQEEQDHRLSESEEGSSPRLEKALLLEELYKSTDPRAFRGPAQLEEQAREAGLNVTRKECQEFLKSQPSYTLFKNARKNYPRNKIVSHYCGHIVQIDLMDMSLYSDANDMYRYVVLSYDSYSKFVTNHAIKSKHKDNLLASLTHLLDVVPFPIACVYSDKEGGLMSRQVQQWFKDQGIEHYTTTSKVKAPGVERLIRTIRLAIAKNIEVSRCTRWLEFLDDFVSRYNNRVHSTTKQRPWDVVVDPTLVISHGHDVSSSLRDMAAAQRARLPPVGSFVRISRLRSPFEKESKGTWSLEVFKVTSHKLNQLFPMLSLQDLTGEPILGSFYLPEVQPIEWSGQKTPSLVHDSRVRRGKKQSLVSFAGFPEKYVEWIDE